MHLLRLSLLMAKLSMCRLFGENVRECQTDNARYWWWQWFFSIRLSIVRNTYQVVRLVILYAPRLMAKPMDEVNRASADAVLPWNPGDLEPCLLGRKCLHCWAFWFTGQAAMKLQTKESAPTDGGSEGFIWSRFSAGDGCQLEQWWSFHVISISGLREWALLWVGRFVAASRTNVQP